jgi:hypothetical protein
MPHDEHLADTSIGFDTIANELKLPILAYALTTKRPILARNHNVIEEDLNLPNLLLVSKRMCGLAVHVYYSCNTFVIRRSSRSWKNLLLGDDYKWRYPPFVHGPHIRKLVVQLQLCSRIDDAGRCLESSAENDWLVLLRPRVAVVAAHEAADSIAPQQAGKENWQTHFPELTELTVRMDSSLSLHLQSESDKDDYQRALLDLPNQATIALQPKLLRLENDLGLDIRSSDPMHGAILFLLSGNLKDRLLVGYMLRCHGACCYEPLW